MFKKHEYKELEKCFSKYLGKKGVSEIDEILNSGTENLIDELNKKKQLKTYEILVLYTKEFDIQKWLETVIPKLIANNYIISDFFGNFLFAYRTCDNGVDEASIKSIINDDTKIAIFIKNTKTINMGTNDALRFNPLISFQEDFLKTFADLDYGKYILMTDDDKS